MKIFLGGTVNGSKWRDILIKKLNIGIEYFNPVVEDWTPDCQLEEIKQRESCDYCLYVITPLMSGFYSIAEVTEDSIKRPEKTIFCVLSSDRKENIIHNFNTHQLYSLTAVSKLIERNKAKYFTSLDDVAEHFNSEYKKKIYNWK